MSLEINQLGALGAKPAAADVFALDDITAPITTKKVRFDELGFLELTGGTMTGDLDMGEQDINNAKDILLNFVRNDGLTLIFQQDAQLVDDTPIYYIRARARDSAGSLLTYSTIQSFMESDEAGEDGSILISCTTAGSSENYIGLNRGSDGNIQLNRRTVIDTNQLRFAEANQDIAGVAGTGLIYRTQQQADTHDFTAGGASVITINNPSGLKAITARLQGAKGTDEASASELTLAADGNTFDITGTTTINTISPTDWQAGAVINLHFISTPTITHNSGGTNDILLGNQANMTAVAGDVLTLYFDGTDWREVGRSVVGGGGEVTTWTANHSAADFDFLQKPAGASGFFEMLCEIDAGDDTGSEPLFHINLRRDTPADVTVRDLFEISNNDDPQFSIRGNGNIDTKGHSLTMTTGVLEFSAGDLSEISASGTAFKFETASIPFEFIIGGSGVEMSISSTDVDFNSHTLSNVTSINGISIGTFALTNIAETFNITNADTDNVIVPITVKHTSSAAMIDGFGAAIEFMNRDTSSLDEITGRISVERTNGDDDAGLMRLQTATVAGTLTDAIVITDAQVVTIANKLDMDGKDTILDAAGNFVLDLSASSTFKMTSAEATAKINFVMFLDRGAGAVDDIIADLKWNANDDASPTPGSYTAGKMQVKVKDPDATAQVSTFAFSIRNGAGEKNQLQCNGVNDSVTTLVNLAIPSAKKLFFDGGANTYISHISGDNLEIVVGNQKGIRIIEIGTENDVICGATNALATSEDNGFLYIPTMAGNPSGTPLGYTGKVAMVYDTTNNELFIYNGSWRSVALA